MLAADPEVLEGWTSVDPTCFSCSFGSTLGNLKAKTTRSMCRLVLPRGATAAGSDRLLLCNMAQAGVTVRSARTARLQVSQQKVGQGSTLAGSPSLHSAPWFTPVPDWMDPQQTRKGQQKLRAAAQTIVQNVGGCVLILLCI